MIGIILKIVNSFMELLNRETDSDEKIKDDSVRTCRDAKKALKIARLIFDGTGKFAGLDVLAKEKFSESDYKKYTALKKRFNKYS